MRHPPAQRFGFRAAGRRRAYHDNREDALIMWRTVGDPHHRVILALETSCDDTCAAAVVGEDGRIASNVIASQGLLHARYGGVVPENRVSDTIWSSSTRSPPTRSSAPARGWTTSTPSPSRAGPA